MHCEKRGDPERAAIVCETDSVEASEELDRDTEADRGELHALEEGRNYH